MKTKFALRILAVALTGLVAIAVIVVARSEDTEVTEVAGDLAGSEVASDFAAELESAREVVQAACPRLAADGISTFIGKERTRVAETRAILRPDLPEVLVEEPSPDEDCSEPDAGSLALVDAFNAEVLEILRTDAGRAVLADIDECTADRASTSIGNDAPSDIGELLAGATSIAGDDPDAMDRLDRIEATALELQTIGAECAVPRMRPLEIQALEVLQKKRG